MINSFSYGNNNVEFMANRFIKIVENVSISFVDAWNAEDFDKISSLLHSSILLSSPQIKILYPENNSGELIGNTKAIEYWKLLCETVGFFKMKQIFFEKVDRRITTKYKVLGTNVLIQSIYILNEYGKIVELYISYPNDILQT